MSDTPASATEPASPAPASADPSTAGAPAPDAAATPKADAEEAIEAARRERLAKLLHKIDTQPDFATGKASVISIQQVARSERSHARALVDLIHDDPAMAGKLLRLINAAYYASVGGGNITNLQRAIALMGFQSVGMLAASLVLYDRLPKGVQGDRMRREFARSQYAAMLAHEFCHDRKLAEHVYLIAVFHRLGELLVGLHAPDELQVMEDKLDERELVPGSVKRHLAREQLARELWGTGIEDLGADIAARWGWPPVMTLGMRSLQIEDPEKVLEGDEYLRVLCTACTALAGELMKLPRTGTPEEQAEARAAVVARFAQGHAEALALDPEQLAERVERNHAAWLELVKALGVPLDESETAAAQAAAAASKRPPPGSSAAKAALAEDLADAVEVLKRMTKRGAPLTEMFETTMKLLQQALDLQRVVVCLRDGAMHLRGTHGLGDRAVVLAPHFSVPLAPPADLFGLLCLKNADTLISDAADPVIAQRLPPWFSAKVKAPTFLVLPLVHEGQVLGMIYGDHRAAGQLQVHDRALVLLKHLREPLVKAMTAPAKAG